MCVYAYFICIHIYVYKYVHILAMFSLAQITGIGQEKYETKIRLLKNCRLEVFKLAYLKEQQV